jgi:pyruvate-ferredoxin/flavodoxin oxidoreductase
LARKKDLGMIAMAYGNVYVAQIALGANPKQTVRALLEAESYRGPSLVIAYSQCIAHGIDMSRGMAHQQDAVKSGYWPLVRHDPRAADRGEAAFRIDSHAPRLPFRDFAAREGRFAMLARSDPQRADELFGKAQEDIRERWQRYRQLAASTVQATKKEST